MVESLTSVIIAAWLKEIDSIKSRCDKAIEQLSDEQLHARIHPDINPISTLIRHISGNLTSRFTDFLTTDGEKPSRNREEEFAHRVEPRAELLKPWNASWALFRATVAALTEEDLDRAVTIRGETHTVPRAIERSIGHTSYHCGQMLMLARITKGDNWNWITIKPGESAQYTNSLRAKHGQ